MILGSPTLPQRWLEGLQRKRGPGATRPSPDSAATCQLFSIPQATACISRMWLLSVLMDPFLFFVYVLGLGPSTQRHG